MSHSLIYCQACGAANPPDQSTCFACAQSLTSLSDEIAPTQLVHQRYRMLTQVGTGGFGAVYKALDTQDQQRVVAIKQINLHGLTAQEMIEVTDGFNREVQMLSMLSHSHLPHMHTHFTDPEHWYVVMDFIDGETLEHYLRDISSPDEDAIRALNLDEVLEIGLQLCDVLKYLHTRQPPIIFRDLKPANIMRTPQGQLYLIDFGAARLYKPGQAKDTIPLGSPGYAAPEQHGRAQTTPRTDIYSLGALLHHLLSRQDPSETPFTFATLQNDGSTGRNELNALVMRMITLDAEQRPVDIAEVEAILLHIRNLRSTVPHLWHAPVGQAPTPASVAQAQQRHQQVLNAVIKKQQTRRRFLMGGLAAVSALSLGGLGYWSYWHPSQLTLEAGSPLQLPSLQSDVSTIAWSPDGYMVAFGLSDGRIVGYQLNVQSSFNPFAQSVFTLSHAFTLPADNLAQPISFLAWSPDTSQLVAISQTGQGQLWNLQNLAELTQQTSATEIAGIQLAAWASNSQDLTFMDTHGLLHFNGNNDEINFFFLKHTLQGKNVLIWSPDGTQLVTQLNTPDTSPSLLVIWSTNQSSVTIPINSAGITTIAWSPNGQFLAALDAGGTLQVWDSQKSYNSVFDTHIATQQQQLVWSPDSRFLATIDDNDNLLLLNRSTGETLVAESVFDPLGRGSIFPGRAMTWLSDNQHIVVVSNNLECWLWALPWF